MCKKYPYGRCKSAKGKDLEYAEEAFNEAKKFLKNDLGTDAEAESYAHYVAMEHNYLKAVVEAANTKGLEVQPQLASFKESVDAIAPEFRKEAIAVYENFAEHPLMTEDKKYARVARDLGKDLDKLTDKTVLVYALKRDAAKMKREGKKPDLTHHSLAQSELDIAGAEFSQKMNLLRFQQEEWEAKNKAPEMVGEPSYGLMVERTDENGEVHISGNNNIEMDDEKVQNEARELVKEARASDGKVKVYEVATREYEMGLNVERPADFVEPTADFWQRPSEPTYRYKQIKDNGTVRRTSVPYAREELNDVVMSTRLASAHNRKALSERISGHDTYLLNAKGINHSTFPVRWERSETRTPLT